VTTLSFSRRTVATDDYCLIKSDNVHIAGFFKTVPRNGAINYYFDSAIRNSILSVHYQTGGGDLQKLGECDNFLCKLNIFMLATCSI